LDLRRDRGCFSFWVPFPAFIVHARCIEGPDGNSPAARLEVADAITAVFERQCQIHLILVVIKPYALIRPSCLAREPL
jgi:hypothetical protein